MTTTLSSPAHEASLVDTPPGRTIDDRVLARVVAGGARRLTPLTRWCSFFTRRAERVERLWLLRRHAMDAEARGQVVTADFFWKEIHREVALISRRRDWWLAYVQRIREANGTDVDQVAERLFRASVRYGLVDTHLAYVYAWQSLGHARAYVHLDYVRRLRAPAGLSSSEDRQYTGPFTLGEIRFRAQAGDWSIALALASELVQRFSDVSEYQTRLVDVRCQATLAAHARAENGRARRAKARALASALYALKKLRLARPHHLGTFDAIARLHLVRAETLAADGLLAEALVDAESALTYSPDIAGGAEVRSRLDAEMQQLRVDSASSADAPRTRNREAKRRQQQASRGFRLVDGFRRSDEARGASEDLPIAQARLVWETIGLTPLEAVDHRPVALNDAILTILNAPPSDACELVELWHRVSQDNPHLQALDTNRVCAYLQHMMFGALFVPAPVDVPPIRVAPAALLVGAPVRSSEPFMFWIFSRCNPVVKVVLSAAIVLAIVTTVLGTREWRDRRVRNEAYSSLTQARDQARYQLMLDAAERFLSRHPIGADDRVPEVEGVYSEALVRWFNETAPPSDEAERRIARYRQLVAVAGEGRR